MTTTTRTRPGAQRRSIHVEDLQVRTLDNGNVEVAGYASVFNVRSTGLRFVERIMPGAFDATLAAGPDVRFLINHDPNQILARTTAGDLELVVDDKGLRFRAELDPEDPDCARAIRKIEKRHWTSMSFGFWDETPRDERWVEVDGTREAHVTRASLDDGDIAVVTYPAYPETEVDVRAALRAAGGDHEQLRDLTSELADADAATVRAALDRAAAQARALSYDDLGIRIADAIEDALGCETYDFWYWLEAAGDGWCVVGARSWGEDTPLESGWYQTTYTVDGDGMVTLDGTWTEVFPRTEWDAATDPEPEIGDPPGTMTIDQARAAIAAPQNNRSIA